MASLPSSRALARRHGAAGGGERGVPIAGKPGGAQVRPARLVGFQGFGASQGDVGVGFKAVGEKHLAQQAPGFRGVRLAHHRLAPVRTAAATSGSAAASAASDGPGGGSAARVHHQAPAARTSAAGAAIAHRNGRRARDEKKRIGVVLFFGDPLQSPLVSGIRHIGLCAAPRRSSAWRGRGSPGAARSQAYCSWTSASPS